MNNNDSLANTAVRVLEIARCSGGMGSCSQQHKVNSTIQGSPTGMYGAYEKQAHNIHEQNVKKQHNSAQSHSQNTCDQSYRDEQCLQASIVRRRGHRCQKWLDSCPSVLRNE